MNKATTAPNPHPLPFMAADFVPGNSQQYIDSITDEEIKTLAICERYYYAGQGQKCVNLAQKLLTSKRFSIKMSAALMFTFGSICAGNPAAAKKQFVRMQRAYQEKIISNSSISEEEKAYAAFMSNLSTVLLHLEHTPFIEMDLQLLPGGVRLMALYVLAHNYYLKGDYSRIVGICEATLSLTDHHYPIGEIYLHLIACTAYMNLNQNDKATDHFLTAWEIAKPEGFIEPFSEHHGLLQGMIEIHLREAEPVIHERIIQQVYVFADAWRKVHNPEAMAQVADDLTTTEFTVAMLANKGWNNEKIAEHLNITQNTVRSHLSSVFRKLNIKSRKELQPFMLK